MSSTAISLKITPDMVLRGQGADPVIIANRSPVLLETAKRAVREGMPLLSPKIVEQTFDVIKTNHNHVYLNNNCSIESRFIAQELASACKISFTVCTIGNAIEEKVSSLFRADPVLSLAFDGFGIAAVETLVLYAREIIERKADKEGLCTSIPFSPGMIEWPLEKGQHQIFSILQPDPLIVRLTSSMQMVPQKSTSMIIGIGKYFGPDTRKACDFCAARQTCRYKQNNI